MAPYPRNANSTIWQEIQLRLSHDGRTFRRRQIKAENRHFDLIICERIGRTRNHIHAEILRTCVRTAAEEDTYQTEMWRADLNTTDQEDINEHRSEEQTNCSHGLQVQEGV